MDLRGDIGTPVPRGWIQVLQGLQVPTEERRLYGQEDMVLRAEVEASVGGEGRRG
jgi:hypothetical protein